MAGAVSTDARLPKGQWSNGGVSAALAHQEMIIHLVEDWRLNIEDAGRIIWLTPRVIRKVVRDQQLPPFSGEVCRRLDLLDETDGLLQQHLGGPDLVPYWLRITSIELGQPPIRLLEGPTRILKQLRWRLYAELSDRSAGGTS
jgi:hypothetical protein